MELSCMLVSIIIIIIIIIVVVVVIIIFFMLPSSKDSRGIKTKLKKKLKITAMTRGPIRHFQGSCHMKQHMQC